jgi:hypothetical protein
MKAIHVQLQPALSTDLDVPVAVSRLTGVAERVKALVRVSEGFDNSPYTNVDFMTLDPRELWLRLQVELRTVPGMTMASIICCQGEHGWDDYLLLHHFDPSQPLDKLE